MGKSAAPTVLDDVGQRISARQNALQGEADSYVSGQEAKQTYGATPDELEKAVSGDATSQGKVRGLLTQKTVSPIEGFTPTTNVDVDDTERLKSDRGLEELLARGQGPTYNQGESAFDLRALRKTPGFDQRLRDIGAQQEAARQLKRDISGTSQKAVEDYGTGQMTAAQKAATDWLTAQGSSIDQGNAKEAADYKARIDALRNGGGWGGSLQDMREVLDKIRASDPSLTPYLDKASGVTESPTSLTGNAGGGLVDANKYVSFADTPGADAFVDEGEAQRFNAIMQLLGKGDVKAAGVRPTGPDRTFDRAGYEQALRDAAAGLKPPLAGTPGGVPLEQVGEGTPVTGAEGPYPYKDPWPAGMDAFGANGSANDPNHPDATGGAPTGGGAAPGAPQPGDPDYVPDWQATPDELAARHAHDNETAHWNVPGGGKLPIGITEGDKKALDPSPNFTNIASKLTPIAAGAKSAGVHPTQLAGKAVEGVGNVGKGIAAVGEGLGKAGGAASDAGKSAVKAVAKFDPKTVVSKVQTNPTDSLKDLIAKGKDSAFYSPAQDPRTVPGFWDAVKAAGYDTNVVQRLITDTLSGAGHPTNIDGALAQAKKVTPKVTAPKATAPKVNVPKLPPPPVELASYGGLGSGEIRPGGGGGLIPDFSQISDVLNKAGGDAAQYGKEKGGSIAKTAKKIVGRG